MSFFFNKELSLMIIIVVSTSVYSDLNLPRGSPCAQPNGNSGLCATLSQCLSLEQKVKERSLLRRDLIQYRCSFEDAVEYFCCASDEISLRTDIPSNEKITESRKSKKACDFYLNNKQDVNAFHVIGGTEVPIEEYPHTCLLKYLEVNYRCGGSLISDRWVLTAAHCKIEYATHVILGRENLTLINEGLEISIEERVVHENHNETTKHNDIALIKLSEAVTFSEKIYPACLFMDNAGPIERTELIVTGYGKSNLLKPASDDLLKGHLHVSSFSQCSSIYRNQSFEIISSQICANGETTKQDSCQGDSGGPLQILIHEQKRISSVVGIVSYGLSSCFLIDGVYTRVSSYLDWIDERVWLE